MKDDGWQRKTMFVVGDDARTIYDVVPYRKGNQYEKSEYKIHPF